MPSLPQIQTIIGGFSKTKDTPSIRWQDIDSERKKRLGSIWDQYDVSADPSKNAGYLAEYAGATPKARQIAGENVDWLSRSVNTPYDPTANYAKLLDINQKALGSFLINPALSELTRKRKERQARAGYGGQGQGSYEGLLEGRILQQLAQESVPNWLGNTTQAYNIAGGLGQQDFLNRMGIIGSGEQYRQLDIPALRYLEPTRLARDDIRANLSNLGAISGEEDKNRAYYHHKDWQEKLESTVDKIQKHDEERMDKDMAMIMSIYGGMYGGGGGGGMYGGGGGGGTPKTGSTGYAPAGYTGYTPAGYGTTGLEWRNQLYDRPWARQGV